MKPQTKKVYTYPNNAKRPTKREVLSEASQPEQSLFTVGTNGDFPTLNKAFDYLRSFGQVNKPVELRMLDGYYIEETLEFNNENFRSVTLTSEGAENVISREFFIANSQSTGDVTFFMDGANSIMPNMGARLRMDETGTPDSSSNSLVNRASGFRVSENSSLQFLSSNNSLMNGNSAGIKDCMGHSVACQQRSNVFLDFESYVRNGANLLGVDFNSSVDSWYTNITVIIGSSLVTSGAIVTGGTSAISVNTGSHGYIQQGFVFGGSGDNIELKGSSTLKAGFTNLRKNAAGDNTNSPEDLVITGASFAQLNNSLAGSNLTPNTITSDGLLIR